MATLDIIDLHASVETAEGPKAILQGVNLHIGDGEIHAIMGPNGSGKSTTAYALAGHPSYEITQGQVLLDGVDITDMTADERAREGLFLAMQYPVEVPGVSVSNFLRTARTAIDGKAPKVRDWTKRIREVSEKLRVDTDFMKRDLNVGFSGGEKKRTEVLQMELLEPKIAVLDETDSGLDVDALRVVSAGIVDVHERTGNSILLITHYNRILRYVKPDFVHVFADGKIVRTGGPELAEELEANGYDSYIEG
ncbi:Fe-S cluster assembly ATPase SufC [Actinotignum urinale]|uniref:Fe-S cluster assembly ATPase SufC n=1 Tax=Actinotignum urinale TaxID=190146 RepID=A0AAW9HS15_9ACTO|nr:Fe-S cluster assembly ATPase SufC [Actinotignum urinale]MDY5128911.1 Fe-S cluster assembly ATPase SufC [Actinotignum urinale]MDY5133126.1 Fe-S cluster assembly ATPase SufC [Actinotignum urinale]MDY5152315.1 Fe-S cluster assembly ATPase SufC [Actinotignum urinale]MDY5154464.1 Fe-S cluster assembly ATPase SufC [Actinotignum urinale]MDY5160341.1 Fe-S cluster assembly ATPase SufC [Actinotignum urinale]